MLTVWHVVIEMCVTVQRCSPCGVLLLKKVYCFLFLHGGNWSPAKWSLLIQSYYVDLQTSVISFVFLSVYWLLYRKGVRYPVVDPEGGGGGGVCNPSFRKLFSEPRAKWLKYLYLTLNMYVLAGIGWGDYKIMQCLKLEFIIFEANWNPTAATLFKFLDLLLGTAAFDIKVKNYSIIIVLFVDKTAHLKLVSRSDAVGRISTLQISTCINMLVWWNILKMISL